LISKDENLDEDDGSADAAEMSMENAHELTINKQGVAAKEDEMGRMYYALETIANDPAKGKYVYSVIADSPTRLSRDLESDEASQIVSGIGSAAMNLSPIAGANLFASYPNRILRKFGMTMKRDLKKQMQQAQQQAGGMPDMSALMGAMGGGGNNGAVPTPAQPQTDPNAMAQMQQAMPNIPAQSVVNGQNMQQGGVNAAV
jgi:hypothetical protein